MSMSKFTRSCNFFLNEFFFIKNIDKKFSSRLGFKKISIFNLIRF